MSRVSRCAFAIDLGSNITLDLVGINNLICGDTCAGLPVTLGATVRINGTGSLTATGGENGGAGIGSNEGMDGCTLHRRSDPGGDIAKWPIFPLNPGE